MGRVVGVHVEHPHVAAVLVKSPTPMPSWKLAGHRYSAQPRVSAAGIGMSRRRIGGLAEHVGLLEGLEAVK